MSDAAAPPPRPADGAPYLADPLGPTFELVISLIQRLDELEQAEKKVKAMDQIVQAVNRLSRVKYELKLEDVLSR